MSKKIAIIESDAGFLSKLRGELEGKGFSVVDTGDGKAAVELVKREKPELIVLSVELSAGQSGYIICGKLKKDEELKKIPVIIVGKDAEGFESHKRLKARAEEYLKKPFDPPAILEKVGNLIGMPEPPASDLIAADESLGLANLGEDEPLVEKAPDGETRADPDLDLLDAAFENISDEPAKAEEPVVAPPDEGLLEEPPAVEGKLEGLETSAEDALDSLGAGEKSDDLVLDALEPLEETKEAAPEPVKEAPKEVVSKRIPRMPTSIPVDIDDTEVQSLRGKVSELEARVRELEDQVSEKTNELEAVKSTTSGSSKEVFALKEQSTKKDKEILRLKGEVNEKDQKVIELEEKLNGLEQKSSELTTEAAKKDAHIKTLTQRSEGAAKDRKSLESAVNQGKDEIRQLSAKLSAAQGELDQAQESLAEMQKQVEAAQSEASTSKTALDALKGEFESAKSAADEAKEKVGQLESELATAREGAERATRLEEEAEGLRKRVAELEESNTKNEERAVKAYARLKTEEKTREKAKKALAVAVQILDEVPAGGADGELVEEALT